MKWFLSRIYKDEEEKKTFPNQILALQMDLLVVLLLLLLLLLNNFTNTTKVIDLNNLKHFSEAPFNARP